MKKRRFSATQQTTVRDLQRIMTQLKSSSLKINQDVMSGLVEVVFDRNGKRFKMTAELETAELQIVRRRNVKHAVVAYA